MLVSRPVVRGKDLDRLILLVAKPMKDLRGTWVHKYLKYGEQATFASRKSQTVPVPQRPSCAGRDPWYDLTKLVKPAFVFWPMSQQFRHIIPSNPERTICNKRFFDVSSDTLLLRECDVLIAILNSTLVGLWKNFYGRYTGTEGSLDTEVIDARMIEVPDPRGVDAALADELTSAVKAMSRRTVGRLIEEQLMDCHSPERARRIAAGPLVLSDELRQEDRRALDNAVFEVLGVTDATERARLVQRLHEDTALHFRSIRVVEIEKQEQRSRTANRRFSVQELAANAWDAAELPDVTPLTQWIEKGFECSVALKLPEERPAELPEHSMFDSNTVYFGRRLRGNERARSTRAHLDCANKGQANLIERLANLGLSGTLNVPADDSACRARLEAVNGRLVAAQNRFVELAECRTGDSRLQGQIVDQLLRWFVHGRNIAAKAHDSAD